MWHFLLWTFQRRWRIEYFHHWYRKVSSLLERQIFITFQFAIALYLFLFDFQRPFDFNLDNETVSELTELPPPGNVFAIDLDDDGLNRAVCNENVSKFYILSDCQLRKCRLLIYFPIHCRQAKCFWSIVVKCAKWLANKWKCFHYRNEHKMHRPEPYRALLFR